MDPGLIESEEETSVEATYICMLIKNLGGI